jgi:hypothetical protein
MRIGIFDPVNFKSRTLGNASADEASAFRINPSASPKSRGMPDFEKSGLIA